MSDSFQNWLCREIRDVLDHRTSVPPLVVWCDPDRAWLELLTAAAGTDGFELWTPETGREEFYELLVRDRFHAIPRAARVVWLPCSRDDITWFKVFELEAEAVWDKSLMTALREYGVEISREDEDELAAYLPAHAREWFDKPKETWKELTPGNAKGTLVDDQRVLAALAGPPGQFERLREEGRFDVFARRVADDFGLPDPAVSDEVRWRIDSLARLLCTDAAQGLPQEPLREPEKVIPPGLARSRALKRLEQWQNDVRYMPSFERLVGPAEETTGLRYWARGLSTNPRSHSSRVVEQTLFEAAADRLDRLEEVDALAQELERNVQTYVERSNGFWGRAATAKVGWRFLVELADVAGRLVENRSIEAVWKSAREACDWYAHAGWRLDHAGERLFKESADLPPQLQRIRARLRRGYLRAIQRVGRKFSELLAREGDRVFELPTAGEVALAELEREDVPTALVFLDACRMDLGQRLAELLNEGEGAPRARVAMAIAPVPSITALGMALALPMRRERLHIGWSDEQKSFWVGADAFDGDLKVAEDRRRWLKERFDVKEWLEMWQVVDGDGLKKASRARRLVAVHGAELDQHDGELKLSGADEYLRRYMQAVVKLRDAGYHRVIVVTDHGFFHWQPEDDEIDAQLPDGRLLWKHRRAMVGYNLSHPTAVRLCLPQSDLEVVVPRSTSAFRTYGGLGFFHGGATLQEIVIPVVIASWPAKAHKVNVVLKPVGNIASEAPRVQVQAATTGQLFTNDVNLLSRRVAVQVKDPAGQIVFRHAEPIAIVPQGDPLTLQLVLVEPRPEVPYGTALVVEVVDADDGALLVQEQVTLKVEIVDW